jgi:hypothetical protein
MIEALGFLISGAAFLYCVMELAPHAFDTAPGENDDRFFVAGVFSLLLAVGFLGALVERLFTF